MSMTIKEIFALMAEDTMFTILIGPDQEIVIGKEDKAIMEALGDVLVDHAMVNGLNRLCIYPCIDLRRAAV